MTTENTPQVVKYTFFSVDPLWRRLPLEDRTRSKRELADLLENAGRQIMVRTYSLMGMRADAEFLIWTVTPDLESVRNLATAIASSAMGSYLIAKTSYLALTRRSTYVDGHEHAGTEDRLRVRPMDRKYLFVYPFVKTHDWYQLSSSERQRMMTEHFAVGHKYPEVRIHTSYSYGLDDQEFVLGFETDVPNRFLELVMELRSAEQRPYTERDTPIFTCLLGSPSEVFETLG